MKKVGNVLLGIAPIFMTFAVQFIVSFVYALVYLLLTGNIIEDTVSLLVAAHLATAVIAFLWYFFAFGKAGEKNPMEMFSTKTWLVMIALAVSLQALIQCVFMLLARVVPTWIESYSEMIEQSGLGELSILSTIATLILAPIGEELSFRGLTYKYLRRAGAGFVLANIIQALLFGIMHLQPLQIVYAAVLGMVLGYLREKYDSIYVPIVMHCIFNFAGTYGISLFEEFEQTVALAILFLLCGGILLIFGFTMMKIDKKTMRMTQEAVVDKEE